MNKPCKILQDMKKRIEAGEDPEHVIPYSFEVKDDEIFIEVLHYAVQVLPEDSPRRASCIRKLKEYARG